MIPRWVSERIDDTTLGSQKRILHNDFHLPVVVNLELKLVDGRPRLNLVVHVDPRHSIATSSKSQG